jgi:hypothetical protein
MSSVTSVGTGSQLVDQVKAAQGQRRDGGLDDLLQQAGVDPSQASTIGQQIHAAIQGVRDSATPGSDDRAAIKQAVDKVLTDNGVDPAKLDAARAKNAGKGRKHHGHHKHGGGTQPGTPTGPATAPTTGTATPTASSTALGVDVEA